MMKQEGVVLPAYTWFRVEYCEQVKSRNWLALLQNTSYYLATYNFVGPSTMMYLPVESERITDCVGRFLYFNISSLAE